MVIEKESDFAEKARKMKGKLIALDDSSGMSFCVLHKVSLTGNVVALAKESKIYIKKTDWLKEHFVDSFD